MKKFTIAIHGGAGTISPSTMTPQKETAYKQALQAALTAGYKVLEAKGSALEAVTHAVIELENTPLFNAGRGSVFTYDGKHEMDASVMNGKNGLAGAVAGVRNVKNPVLLANAVMEHTDFVFLHGSGAEELARVQQLTFCDDQYFFDDFRYQQWQEVKGSDTTKLDHSNEKKFGTVGAVAKDIEGNLAAATSTGGMTNKRYSRIGDTPVIGAGTYANNSTCAVSCTGHGEYFIRSVVAYDIHCLMEYNGLSLKEACEKVVLDKLVKSGGEGGIIAIDQTGVPQLIFNSEGMYRGYYCCNEQPVTEIYR
ncbi:MAG: isoaspartyl peptidase/L-asparaginase [Bacteroidetes bacterium]|jgi:beta-aspartyl-peptidase (threonine type)|nr:isoaspartyl peptidase/L-asparaginase [Bacteroidota bacterium]MBX7237875.1 isoaspartyl peptidase/L-asparaginase [Bacteroidia bacterium]MCC7515316.1 isoaspartyl peptidase/L-asparaginase [Bacteroidia bacterium]MCW5918921.1 isoaspartyl peptidase/L-asparaginase [Bacteroidota bacterium]HMU77944.1 isoaspartyl peptidase/L-asparaginase [Bacteroidia bacterium]